MPRPSDQLVITTDGAIRNNGVGALLHILREGKTLVGGYFSMKLRTHHVKWLPCEVEALAIASAIDIQGSDPDTQILTDSRPCVQAFAKLRRGRFSSSARVATFLSTLSRHKVTLQHISGKDNETADYLSRNPAVTKDTVEFVTLPKNHLRYSPLPSRTLNPRNAVCSS